MPIRIQHKYRPYLSCSLMLFSMGLMACGGSRASSRAPASGGSAASASEPNLSGVPRWVERGATAVNDGGRRIFYGVGVASGIRNSSLLRQTAANRARADLASVFEVYTASLMKDYMDSEGNQSIENAIKTFSSMGLKGSTIVDNYIGSDGSLYALAALDMKVVADVIQAEKNGIFKSATTKVDPNDIFDKHAKKSEPEPPPPALAAENAPAEAAAAAPASDTSVQAKGGAKPAWVTGADPRFNQRQYLCGVGFSTAREPAENAAFANLSRIFIAHVKSVSKDFMGAYTSTGAESVETQSVSTLTQVSTAKTLKGVQLMEVWEGEGSIYALACMDRAKSAAELRTQISEADESAGKHLQRAGQSKSTAKVRELGKALEVLRERVAYNAELRIVDPDGIGVSAQYSHVDVADAFNVAADALKIGILAQGPYADICRSALVEGLTKRGYKVTEGLADGMDVIVDVNITVEDGGKGSGRFARFAFARVVIIVEVKDPVNQKVLDSVRQTNKQGHRNREEAERRAVRGLAKKLVSTVSARVEKAMLR